MSEPLTSLPPELLLALCQVLPQPELSCLSRTCTELYHLAGPILWRDLAFIIPYPHVDDPKAVNEPCVNAIIQSPRPIRSWVYKLDISFDKCDDEDVDGKGISKAFQERDGFHRSLFRLYTKLPQLDTLSLPVYVLNWLSRNWRQRNEVIPSEWIGSFEIRDGLPEGMKCLRRIIYDVRGDEMLALSMVCEQARKIVASLMKQSYVEVGGQRTLTKVEFRVNGHKLESYHISEIPKVTVLKNASFMNRHGSVLYAADESINDIFNIKQRQWRAYGIGAF